METGNTFDMKKGINPIILYILLTFGSVGLLVCFLAFGGENLSEMPLIGKTLTLFFTSIFVFTLIVLVPVQILYFDIKNRDNSTLRKAVFKDYIAMLFGVCDADVKAPKWITYPLLIVLWLLIAIMVIVLTGIIISRAA